MTLILSGTDGVSDIDGTAATPAIRGTDANTGIFFPAADTIAFAEGGAEAMRITSAGTVGIGTTTTPTAKLWVESGRVGLSNTYKLGWHSNPAHGDLANYITGDDNSNYVAIGTNATERMRIDSNGRLLVNQTASYSGVTSAIELSGTAGANQPAINTNAFVGTTAANTGYLLFNRSRGSSVGTNTIVASGDRLGMIRFQGANGTDYSIASEIYGEVDGTPGASNDMPGRLIFATTADGSGAATERARITSGGYFKASNSGAYLGSTSPYHEMRQSAAGDNILELSNTNTSTPFGMRVQFTGATPNNTTQYFLSCDDSTNIKAIIYSNGTYGSRTGTYGLVSDIKLKQDVVDASSQWDDIKALRIVKYRLKDEVAADPNYPAYIGVIAQEVEQVSPGLVEDCADFENVTKTREVEKTREVTPAVLDDEGNEVTPAVTETYTETEEYTERVATGTVTKSVKSSIIYMKAVKALQEAMTRIEALEVQNTALEARLAALENK